MNASPHEFAALMVPVAIEILGEPNKILSNKTELRWGSRGALSVNMVKGTWCDHSDGDCGGGVLDLLRSKKGLDKLDGLEWLRVHKYLPPAGANGRSKIVPKIVATYDYTDPSGKLLFQVCRFEPKDFRQRQPDGNGGWRWKMDGVERVIYRLPAVIAAVSAGRTVYIAEGEKGVHAIETLGLVGTCSPAGAGKWHARYNSVFSGGDVVVLTDNDPQATTPDGTPRWHPDGRPVLPGQDHGADVAKHLRGVAKRVRVLPLPGLPEKGDIADWVAAGGTAAKFEELTAVACVEPPLPNGKTDYGHGEDPAPEPPPHAGRNRRRTEDPGPNSEAPEDDAPWMRFLQRDERGQVIPNLANAALAMRQAPELAGIAAFDEMMQHSMVNRSLPGSRMAAVTTPRPLTDADVSAMQEWLQRHALRRIGRDTVQQACELVAREHAFHPVKEYLSDLVWDEKPRLDTWLSYYLGAESSPYTAKIGRWFLIATVARIMQPGCKCDYMLVLEGEQGSRKSAACAILAGMWFSDNLPDLHQGDSVRLSMHLRGKWLIEVGEMSSIGKADTAALKLFLTQREERYTPKYARNEVIEPRQCLFVGTTNASAYLRDETGGRRFWPVLTGTIDTDALAEDRDQLFAEAMAAFRAGEPWWPDAEFEATHVKPEQDKRFIADEWENLIRKWVEASVDQNGCPHPAKTRCTLAEVAVEAVQLENTGRLGTIEQRRITSAFERLGWTRGRNEHGRWWQAPVS